MVAGVKGEGKERDEIEEERKVRVRSQGDVINGNAAG